MRKNKLEKSKKVQKIINYQEMEQNEIENLKKQKARQQQRRAKLKEQQKNEQKREEEELKKRNRMEQKRKEEIKKHLRNEQKRKEAELKRQQKDEQERKNELKKQQKIEQKQRKKRIKNQEKERNEKIKEDIIRRKKIEQLKQMRNNDEAYKQKMKLIRRRKLIIRNILIGIFFIFIIVLFLLSPVFNIKEVTVTGNSKVSSDTIISLLHLGDDTNQFKLSYSTIGQRIKSNPYIKTVKVKRSLPSKLEITVTEREPAFQLEFGSSYVLIDDEGYILEILKTPRENTVKIRNYQTSEELIVPGNRLCESDLQKLDCASKIIGIAKNYEIADIVTTIIFDDDNQYSLYLESEQKTVHLGNDVDFEVKLLYTKEILQRTKGEEGEIFVDMNLNEKNPYFRPKI